MIDSGFNDSFWVALDSKAASNCWSGLVDEVVDVVELVELESVLVLESEADA